MEFQIRIRTRRKEKERQEKERQEYLEYIDYLIHEGYVANEVEDLHIGKLQGVQGLQALRITVKLPK